MNVDNSLAGIQDELLEMLELILGRKVADVEQSFFDMGAGSVLIIQLYALIEQKRPGVLAVQDVFDNSSVAALARRLQGQRAPDAGEGGGHVDF